MTRSHATIALTLDTYSHLFGDDLDAVAARMDASAEVARAAVHTAEVIQLRG